MRIHNVTLIFLVVLIALMLLAWYWRNPWLFAFAATLYIGECASLHRMSGQGKRDEREDR